MGSLEEEQLFQMVYDFIESESPPPPPIFSSSSESPTLNHHAKFFILQEILGSSTSAEAEVIERVLKHMRNRTEAEKTSSLKKWLVMRLKRDGYNASLCQTSWPTTLGCTAGDYEYIGIVMEDENGMSMRLIVDIDFKSQFELARPTTTYKKLLATLPIVFVGDEQKLKRTISLVCSAAKQSLRDRGLHIPPWRTNTYMQSKWLSLINGEVRRESRVVGPLGSSDFISMWANPVVKKPKRRGFGGGLSSQFSNMSTKCC